MNKSRFIKIIVGCGLFLLMSTSVGAQVWTPGRVNNSGPDKDAAEQAVKDAYADCGFPIVGDEYMIHVNSVTGDWATLEEVLANIYAVANRPYPPGATTVPAPSGLGAAQKAYQDLQGVDAYPVSGTVRNKVVRGLPSVATSYDGSPEGGGPFSTTVTGTMDYEEYVKVKENDPSTDEDDEYDWKPRSKTVTLGAFTTAVIIPRTSDRETPVAEMPLKVVDVTAPWFKFVAGFGIEPGNIPATTGDFKLVKVEIYDNNRYADIRTPFLHYESRPSGGADDTWATEPLILDIDGSKGAPPFNNFGVYRAMMPLPHNYKGYKCIRWYVDNHDGSMFSHHCGAGNHNKGDLSHSGGAQADVENTDYGYLTLYDNDRPNIAVHIYEKTRTGIEKIATYRAAENWKAPDMYQAFSSGGPLWKGSIPDDGLLRQGTEAIFLPEEIVPYVTEPVEMAMAADLQNQVEDADARKYKFKVGERGEVLYEDRKYFFVVNANDNIEFLADAGTVKPVPKLKRTKVWYQFVEPSENINMGTFEPVEPGNWRWYLCTEDPKDFDSGAKECYAFEHIFHRKIAGDDPDDTAFLNIKAEDTAGHMRYFWLTIRVGDVRSDFHNYDQKMLRPGEGNIRREQEE